VPRILLVDDDIAEISTVKRALTRSGHQPLLATNTSDALAMISQAPPHLVVVGATCEGGAALAFVRRLTGDPATSGIPVILLGDVGDAAPGAIQLSRPVDPAAFEEEVRVRLPSAKAAAPPASGPARAASLSPLKARAAGALLGNAAPKPGLETAGLGGLRTRPVATGGRAGAPSSTESASGPLTPPADDDDGDAERRAAVDALRARAAELRRGGTGRPPLMGPAPSSNRGPSTRDPAARAAPAARPSPGARSGSSPRIPVPAIDLDDGGLEEVLRRAEEAERAHLAERRARERQTDRARVEAAQRAEAEDLAIEKARRAEEQARRARNAEERARTEAEERAGADRRAAEEARRAEEESRRARDAEERARAEEQARADAESRRQQEERRRAEAARRAEEERRRAEGERRRAAEAQQRAEEEARGREEAEARARAEEQARAEAEARARAEEQARADAEARARAEEQARADAEARARVGEQARADAEARARAGEQARAEAEAKREEEERRRTEAARRAKGAEEKARAEAEARHKLEDELEQLRLQMEAQKRAHEQEIATVLERAAAEDQAAEELRQLAEEHAREEAAQSAAAVAAAEAAKREAAEAQLKAAMESAQAQMEELRRRTEEEARRRAEAEAQLARMAEGQERFAAEQAALSTPPAPSPEEEARRQRVQALRRDRSQEFDPPPWLEPSAPPAPTPAAPVWSPAPPAGVAGPADTQRPLLPPPPELREGSLGDLPAPRLLVLAARYRLSGRLDFAGEASRSVFFEEGRVVGASSALPEERVEELALRLGLITRDQHRQVAQAAATLGTRRAAVLLLDRGFLKPTELTPLVRRRTEEVLFGIFADAAARFRWLAAEVPPDERTALDRGPLALAVEGVRRRWLAPRVDALLGGPGTLLAPAPGGPPIGELGLSPDERRTLALADGLRALDEIVGASPLDPLTTRQVLAALVLVGALAVRIHQAGTPASAVAAAIDLARVREKLDQVRRADYFTILGVGRLCTPHEVREAAERLAAEFDPGRFDAFTDPGLSARLEEILRVVADAREVLSDDRLRSEYLSGLGG
jgi:hypothetical protein